MTDEKKKPFSCGAVTPWEGDESGGPLRCELEKGHEGPHVTHEHSIPNYWEEEDS